MTRQKQILVEMVFGDFFAHLHRVIEKQERIQIIGNCISKNNAIRLLKDFLEEKLEGIVSFEPCLVGENKYVWMPPKDARLYFLEEYAGWNYYLLKKADTSEVLSLKEGGDFKYDDYLPVQVMCSLRWKFGVFKGGLVEGISWPTISR